MSTMFLSSSGLRRPIIQKEFLKLLNKQPSDLTLAHIYTASKVQPDTSYVDRDRQAFQQIGFKVKEVDIEGMTKEVLEDIVQNIDIIYMQGGNGYYLLKHLRASGLDVLLPKLIEKGIIYFGTSAGTYIVCPTIEMHQWKHSRRNTYGVTNIAALNLVPYLVSVHYDDSYYDAVKKGISETTLPVRILSDDQALVVKDGETTLLGNGEEILLQ